MKKREWVRLPSKWIEDGGLKQLQWTNSEASGSNNIAALMVLAPIAHHADDEGMAICTYDRLALATGLSRAKVSAGLTVLEKLQVIDRAPSGRSTFQLLNYNEAGGWSKLPARGLYGAGRIIGFEHFHLRTMNELHALKLYYLFARRRSNSTNMAHISYDKIEAYTGIARPRIRKGISFLASVGMVHVEHVPSRANERGTANAYRLPFIDPYVHLGTRGRDTDFALAE
ncbi:helix-turn-helix domain-containing protein [Bradyrhizobium sp. CCGUVB1N3]|uniref:helix-turn-helix domain-containing protein n=1 Tax=Bradyrhizobium sp. CCGUVB1N3 TaxID=2949629 RepID=UPI0020B33F67|nr:helix-turn-helix domain-containing protein [Bradyrhizobium sp. CCGUVB1N3]MCP3473817.1 helix-turn-helix domain-containing protein [Bradyrhizobium sp. CCGUVB1N3]